MQSEKHRILVVDDEESMREFLSIMLYREGYAVDAAADGAQAVERLKEHSYDLVISDIKMPRMTGLQLLSYIMERTPETVVIMITAFSTTDEAVEAMKHGAYDYITKPFKNEEIRLIVKNALERKTLRQENTELKRELGRRYSFGSLIGKSKAMQEVYDLIQKVAASRVNVLITGESGTGKELVAHAIHYNSPRANGTFVKLNCAALPDNLLESELFGHEKGAFTGAAAQRKGRFEQANGGTIFLDEIGEISPTFQAKLLRVLQEGEFERVGSNQTIKVDVRVIAATNRDLESGVEEGKFREDLYYRLNVMPIFVPALRERAEDIPSLAQYLVQKISRNQGRELTITESAVRLLMRHDWPGNVRELENCLERAAIMSEDGAIDRDVISLTGLEEQLPLSRPAGSEVDLDAPDLDDRERVIAALEQAGWVQAKAARLLNMTPRQIAYRIQTLNIKVKQF